MEWLSHNVATVASLVGMAVLSIGAWYSSRARIDRLEEENNNRKKDDEARQKAIEKLEGIVTAHQSDTTLHIDPHRDEKRWDDLKTQIFEKVDGLMNRFDSTDRKIERLMMVTPPTAKS